MRIAIWHNLPSGGGKRALYYHVKGLVERGHYVESWCPSTADQSYLPLNTLITEHVKPFTWRPQEPKVRLGSWLAPYFDIVNKLKEMDRHTLECAQEINRGGFDLLFANSCMFFRTTAIGRYVSLPRALYLQEPCRSLYEALPRSPWVALPSPKRYWEYPKFLVKFVQNWIYLQGLRIQMREEIRNARIYDKILVNSLYSRESVLRAYGLDAEVCYLGIDTDVFREFDLPREDLVVGIGAFVPEKNIEFVIKAVGKLSAPRPRLVWVGNVGSSRYIEGLKQLAASLDVSFEPWLRVDDSAIVDLLNRAAVMAYAPRLEPFGLVPLEASACRLPVVAVAEGGVRETVIDGVNGLLVESNPRAMAQAIERLLNDFSFARALGNQGHRIVIERWTEEQAVDRLEQHLFSQLEDDDADTGVF